MKVLFGEDLCAGEETWMEICLESGSRGEGIAMTEIAEDVTVSADPEGVEACPLETIIQTWRRLRRDLQGTSSRHSLLAVRRYVY